MDQPEQHSEVRRVLHLSMLYPPHVIGGAELSLKALAEEQSRQGYAVTVVCSTPSVVQEETLAGVRVVRLPHSTAFWAEEWERHTKVERFLRKLAMPFNARFEQAFAEQLEIFRPDVVHTHSMVDVSTGCWRVAARLGYPVVHTLRDYDLVCSDGSMYHSGETCGPKCRIVSVAKKSHQRHVSAVTGISKDILSRHLKLGCFSHISPDMRRVIWNSAHLSPAEESAFDGSPGRSFTFGYLGRLTEDKGIEDLLVAARLCKNRNWRLSIAGRETDYSKRLSRIFQDVPAEFVGFVEPSAFLRTVDVLIVPSRWAEPFGRIVIEAYSMGVPVIGSRAGGIPDLIAGNSDDWLFPAGDVAALAVLMCRHASAGRERLPDRRTFADILARTEPAVIAGQYGRLYTSVLNG